MVLPFAGPLKETDHVLGHELVHAFQFDMTGSGGGVLIEGIPTVMRMPLWFVEGMAEYLSIGPVDPNSAMWMRDAVRTELPDLKKLSDPRFFPYRYGHALWSYIAGRWGDDAVGRILKASRASSGNLSFAFQRVLRMPLDTVVAEWHEEMREYYLPLKEQTTSLTEHEESVALPPASRSTEASRTSPDCWDTRTARADSTGPCPPSKFLSGRDSSAGGSWSTAPKT
jgi:hypothetical protein